MCLNFILSDNSNWIQHQFSIELPKIKKREIFPNYSCPIIRTDFDKNTYRLDFAHFGLIPSWVQYINKKSIGYKAKTSHKSENLFTKFNVETYNARVETISSKPCFRASWNHKHFAIVAIESFFQPKYTNNNVTRWSVCQKNGEPLVLACLWEMSHDLNLGQDILSFCILTEDASNHPIMKQFHSPKQAKRMPFILPEHLISKWLNANLKEAQDILFMKKFVDLEVNAVDHYGPIIKKPSETNHGLMQH